MGALALLLRHAPRFLQAIDGREGDLVLRRVLAGGFAERLGGFLDVEDVVHNLERQADVLAVAGERFILRGGGAGGMRAHAQRRAQQRSGLGAMDGLQQLRVGRLALAFEIGHLAADHAADGAAGDASSAIRRVLR